MPYGSGLPRFIPSFTYQPCTPLADVIRGTEHLRIVDLGAGGRKLALWVETVDFAPFPGTTHVCDFVRGRTPYEDGSVDVVIATGILQHVADDRRFIAEVYRMLKPGGMVHVEAPFLVQWHPDPIDCRRFTLQGLEFFLHDAGFKIVKSGAHIGPTVALLTLTSYWLNLLFRGRSPLSRGMGTAALAAFSVVAWPLRYLDRWLIRKPDAHRIAFGVYATARKIRL